MAILPSDLIDRAREIADMVPDPATDPALEFVQPQTWLAWANAAQEECWSVVSGAQADTFFKTFDYAVSSGNTIPLPADFRRLRGLDINPTSEPPTKRSIRKFNFANRNGQVNTSFNLTGFGDPRYRVVSRSTLLLEPDTLANGLYRLFYIQGPTAMNLAYDRAFAMVTGDMPLQDPSGNAAFVFANAEFVQSDVGGILTVGFDAPNTAWSGTYIITKVWSPTFAAVTPAYPDPSGFTAPAAGSCSVVQVETPMMQELEEYAEYIAQRMAKQALVKEESYEQAATCDARIAQMRTDILTDVETDEGEADTVVDMEGYGRRRYGWV